MDEQPDEDGWRASTLANMGYVGLAQFDFTTQKVRGDRNVGHLFGVDPEKMLEGVPLDWLDHAYFGNDLDLLKRNRLAPVHQGGHARYEYRLRNLASGGCLWVRSIAHLEMGRDGRLLRASGALFDTTARPPAAPGIYVSADDGLQAGEAGAQPSPAELDRLSGHLVQASRSARTLGLRAIEADLRLMLGRVGALLSEKLRFTAYH